MKKYIAIIGAVAFASAVTLAQDPSPSAAPIIIPPTTTVLVTKPISLTLSPAQVQGLATTLGGAGVTLPPNVRFLTLSIITTGSNAGGAQVRISF